jgi:hypothetical protein
MGSAYHHPLPQCQLRSLSTKGTTQANALRHGAILELLDLVLLTGILHGN